MRRVHDRARTATAVIGALAGAAAAYWIGRSLAGDMAGRALAIFALAAVFWAAETLPLFATALVVVSRRQGRLRSSSSLEPSCCG